MQRGEIVKSKAPRRWMVALLVFLLVAGVAIALLWSEQSNAQTPASSFGQSLLGWHADGELRCEMVRVWPLPADCVFVFGR